MVDKKKNKKQAKGNHQPVTSTETRIRWIYLFLFAFAFLLNANTLHHEYAFDDTVVISENAFTRQGIHGIPGLIKNDLFAGVHGKRLVLGGGRWRPLSLITFALEYQFFGFNPHVGHWINVLLFCLAMVILFLALQKMFPGKILLNFLVTLIFIAHPVHTEVVANLKSRDEILSFMGLCLTIYWCFMFLETRRVKYIIYSCLSYFLALTSKENGITFIVILPVMFVLLANKKWKESMLVTIPFLAVALIYSAIRWKLVGISGDKVTSIIDNPFLNASFSEKYATIAAILGKYLLLLFFPFKLSGDYSYNQIPITGWGNITVVLSLIVYVILLVYAVLILIRSKLFSTDQLHHRIAAFGILFYLITISIVSNILFNVGAPLADRFLFLPSLGFCIAAVIWMLSFFKIQDLNRLKLNGVARAVFLIVIVLFAVRTIARNADWKNNFTLFTADIQNSPNSARINFGYGNLFRDSVNHVADRNTKKEMAGMAINAYSKALSIYPAYPDPCYNMGVVYYSIGDTTNAINMYYKTLEIKPDFTLASFNLGAIFYNQGKYKSALIYIKKCAEIDPENFNNNFYTGLCYQLLNDFKNAIVFYQQAFQINPHDVNVLRNLSISYANLGDTVQADYYKSLMEKH